MYKRNGKNVRLVALVMGCVGVTTLSAWAGDVEPSRLRCEYLVDPLGIDAAEPRLSWELKAADPEKRGLRQAAYQVLVASSEDLLKQDKGDLWDSGKVVSDETVGVAYGGRELKSRDRCLWKVKVWDQSGQDAPWSRPASWTMGLLKPKDWQAKWIAAPMKEEEVTGPHNGYHSAWAANPDEAKWVQIDLQQPQTIGAVRLHGARPYDLRVAPGYSFPVRLKVEIANQSDFSDAKTVVDRTEKNVPNPGKEPLVLEFSPATARHVRLHVTRLAEDVRQKSRFGFALTQMEVLSGGKNVARGKPVASLDSIERKQNGWGRAMLTDGRTNPGPGSDSLSRLRPAPRFRKQFEVRKPIRRATVSVTALGLYELGINGQRVGDERLAPQWTHYGKRVLYQVFDVTKRLHVGANAMGATVGDGWYRQRLSFDYLILKLAGKWGGTDGVPRLLLQLDIDYADGTSERIVSNESWNCCDDGPIQRNTLYFGTLYDARKETPGWDQPNFEAPGWEKAVENPPTWDIALSAQMNEPVRVIREFPPVKKTQPSPGVLVYDFGQNMSGVCRVVLEGAAGTAVKLRYAEAINPDGSLYVGNLRHATENGDTYVLDGKGPRTFEAPFTFHGFRYVEVTGLSSPEALKQITALAISSDVRRIGHFSCSDRRLSTLWEYIHWTYRANMLSVYTDCSGRDERLGWSEPGWQDVCSMLDISAFGRKRCRDIRDSQKPDGFFLGVAPETNPRRYAAAWSDNGVFVPWINAINFDDRRLLRESYQSTRQYVDALHKDNPNHLWQKNLGKHWDDWLDRTMTCRPGSTKWLSEEPGVHNSAAKPCVPHEVFGTVYWAYSTQLVSRMAEVLGRPDEAEHYAEMAAGIRAAYAKAYVKSDGTISTGEQAAYALPMSLGLLSPDLQAKAFPQLLKAIADYQNHLSTGIYGTHHMLMVLSERGHHDLAYQLVMQPSMPSYGFMVDNDATAIWERFDSYRPGMGFNPFGMNALNHVSFCAVGEWIFGNVGGIRPDPENPGYRHFFVRPNLGGGVTWVKSAHDSVRGRITSNYEIEDGQLVLSVTVPPNTRATVFVPTSDAASVAESGKPAAKAEGVKFLHFENGSAVYETGSGSYQFESAIE